MSKWDASHYLKFGDERTQPARDLAGRIEIDGPRRIIDLGCGPGNSTAVLRQRWPEAEIIGLDSSEEMLEAASRTHREGCWLWGDAGSWSAEPPFDIVFSNAALHWVPDHSRLFPHLLAQVAPGGILAVQMPAHHRSHAHRIIREVADDPRWRHLMNRAREAMTSETPGFYYDLLQPLTARLTLWETDYYHVLENPRAIVEWFRATGLRPYLDALEDEQQKLRFEERLIEAFDECYPRRRDGRLLFPFPRLFLLATPQRRCIGPRTEGAGDTGTRRSSRYQSLRAPASTALHARRASVRQHCPWPPGTPETMRRGSRTAGFHLDT